MISKAFTPGKFYQDLKLTLSRDHFIFHPGNYLLYQHPKWYSQPKMSRAQFSSWDLVCRTASLAFRLKTKVKKYQVTLAIRISDFTFSPETRCHSRITRYLPFQKTSPDYGPGGHMLVRRKVI